MEQTIKPRDVVRVKAGKASGLVGEVVAVEGDRVRVEVQGVKDDVPIHYDDWLSVKSVERAK